MLFRDQQAIIAAAMSSRGAGTAIIAKEGRTPKIFFGPFIGKRFCPVANLRRDCRTYSVFEQGNYVLKFPRRRCFGKATRLKIFGRIFAISNIFKENKLIWTF